MHDLWDSGPSLTSPGVPERDGPGRSGPEQMPARAQQIDWSATGLSPAVAEPIAFGLNGAYGPAWQKDYGTLAGRTLTGAAPDEAFPPAATPDGQPMREALVQILSPGAVGADHPDVQAVLRGALADGMTQADHATVNRAALTAAVERDPEALLDVQTDRRITPARLAAWRELAMTPIPSSVSGKMTEMNREMQRHYVPSPQERPPEPWRTQPIADAAGPVVNMDEYAVRVERMPPGVTPAEFLREIRADMNAFVDTRYSRFTPYPDGFGLTANSDRWANSSNPEGSFVSIKIPGDQIAPQDPGTVAVIDSADDHWTFATVYSPQDNTHPVSGNRQFGYTEHGDGSVTFYTRGVDRITTTPMMLANRVLPGERSLEGMRSVGRDTDGIVFAGGDALWRSFQQRIEQDVERRGDGCRTGRGAASVGACGGRAGRARVGAGVLGARDKAMTGMPEYLRRIATWSLVVAVSVHAYVLFLYAVYGFLSTGVYILLAGVVILLLTQVVLWVLFVSKRGWRRSSWRVWVLAFFPLLMAISLVGTVVPWKEILLNPSSLTDWHDPYEPVIVDDSELRR